ncbi:hypothetical protein A4E84_00560 [Streptomyces qaidamensis]|uniref:Uncharacterized protein n=1 Tax=Streptomyces qaidamensis TaxID=1783515 RepID=A0A143BSP6_9ACTN|nr:hypothetical protein A4E84_00560 [Streptomyces qaidamensis]
MWEVLQPGAGLVGGHGPQGPVSLVVELGEFVFVVDSDGAVVVDHRVAGRRDVCQDLGVHLAAGAAQFVDAQAHVLGVPADHRVRRYRQAPRLLVLLLGLTAGDLALASVVELATKGAQGLALRRSCRAIFRVGRNQAPLEPHSG